MKRPLSLTTRLTLLFGLILTGVLTALGLYIYSAMAEHFVEQDMVLLRSHAEEISDMVEKRGHSPVSRPVADELDHTLSRHDIYFEIIDRNDQVLYRNDDISVPQPLLRKYRQNQSGSFQWGHAGHHYRSLILDRNGTGVVVSVSTMHHEQFLKNFGRRLTAMLSLVLMMTWGLSWFAVRHGLAPLKMIRDRAASITPSNLDKTIPLERIPDELIPLAREINQMMLRLQEAFHRLVAFSSDLAHEIRTPVSNLLTQIQVVLAQDRTAEDYRDVLASSAEECERLSRMISEMLFLAKAENGNILPSVEQVDLAEQVGQTLEYFEALADSKGIVLTNSGHAHLDCDRSMLRRALSNLVSNAIRYGESGSVIETAITSGDTWIDISVRNRGKDIPEEHLRHIFDRFYRVNAARSHDDHDGLGLGLAITRAIMRAHGGLVDVESRHGVTTFTLKFPVQQPQI